MASKSRPFILILLALVIGGIAAFAAQRWVQDRVQQTRAEVEAGYVEVLAAARKIEFGEQIDPEDVELIRWPENSLPEGVYRSKADITNKVANTGILKGELILSSRAVDRQESTLLATRIETNKRAVTVRVNDVLGVAGFLLPGSRVDVLASTVLDRGERKYKTKTLLKNIKVLAVDQTSNTAGEDKPVVVRAVTLEVTPREAETLVEATQEGTVQLVLRNPNDTEEEKKPEPKVAAQPVYRGPSRVSSTKRPTMDTVTVVRGTYVDTVKAQR